MSLPRDIIKWNKKKDDLATDFSLDLYQDDDDDARGPVTVTIHNTITNLPENNCDWKYNTRDRADVVMSMWVGIIKDPHFCNTLSLSLMEKGALRKKSMV